MAKVLVVYGDFNNVVGNRLPLNLDEVRDEIPQFRGGMRVVVTDGEIDIEGILEFQNDRWYVNLNWETRKDAHP